MHLSNPVGKSPTESAIRKPFFCDSECAGERRDVGFVAWCAASRINNSCFFRTSTGARVPLAGAIACTACCLPLRVHGRGVVVDGALSRFISRHCDLFRADLATEPRRVCVVLSISMVFGVLWGLFITKSTTPPPIGSSRSHWHALYCNCMACLWWRPHV